MKKHFITLGALALMLTISTSELQANTPSSQIDPVVVSQGYNPYHTISYYEFEYQILSIISDVLNIDINDINKSYTFYEIGADSIDYIDISNKIDNELYIDINPYNYVEFYHNTIEKFINILWRKYLETNDI